MWLRNYYNILTAAILADDTNSSTTPPTDYSVPIMLHCPDDVYRQVYFNTPSGINDRYGSAIFSALSPGKCNVGLANSSDPQLPASYVGAMLAFGTGTTPETYEDYRIETPISSGLTLVSAGGSLTNATAINNVTHHVTSKRSFTVTNSSASPITITEFAIYVSRGSSATTVCVYREVLTTPVTLNPSESLVVEFQRDGEIYNYTPY